MDRDRLRPAVEALLFASDSPLSLSLLSESLGAEPQDVAEALQELKRQYDQAGHGVQVGEMAGGWIVTTREEFAPQIRELLRGKRKARLSRAALEALAIVAYKQPVTRPEIESIRGVDSGSALATLLERDLITIRGRSDVVGRPLLYGTTPQFLTYFGLRELTELPKPEELKALIQDREAEEDDEPRTLVIPVPAVEEAGEAETNPETADTEVSDGAASDTPEESPAGRRGE